MTEEWRSIPGFDRYEASTNGRIRSLPTIITQLTRFGTTMKRRLPGKILNPHEEKNGYLYVRPRPAPITRQEPVHKLITLTFLGKKPENYDIHHKNKDKTDNRSDNLEYIPTSKHRKEHSQEHLQHGWKLSENDVQKILTLSRNGMTQVNIAAEMNITQAHVSKIIGRKSWIHIT